MKWRPGDRAMAFKVSPWLAAAGVVVLMWAMYAAWDYIEAKRVTAAIVAVAHSGGSINGIRIERSEPAVDPEQDAAPLYVAATTLASTTPPEFSMIGQAPNFPGVPGSSELKSWYTTGSIPGPALDRTKVILAQHREALQLLDAATSRQFQGFAPGTTYAAQIIQFERLCLLCSMQTAHAAATGDGGLAARSLEAELALIGRPDYPVVRAPLARLLVSAVGLSLLLNRNDLGASDLESLARAFERADDDEMLERNLDDMRANSIDAFLDRARYSQNSIGLSGLIKTAEPTHDLTLLPRPAVAYRLRERLSIYADLIAASRLPWTARLDQIRAIATRRQWRDDAGFLVKDGWSTNPWGFTALPLNIESARVARAAIAVERYRLAHHGQLPDTLDQTVPMYLPDVPIDPYSGRPIQFVKIDGGYEVYGVSFDRADDGGDLLKDQPVIRVRR